jgi:hypothetical protein
MTTVIDIEDDLIYDFNILMNTYDEYDEYRILVESVLNICNNDLQQQELFHLYNYDIEKTKYRYKRYLKYIKLNNDLRILLENYIKNPEYILMKKIDLYIYNLLQ